MPRGRKSAEDQVKEAHLKLLEALRNAKPEDRHEICQYLSEEGLHGVCQFVYNIAHAKLGASKSQRRKLRSSFDSHEKDLELLRKPSASVRSKRKALKRQATTTGGLGPLLKTGLPLFKGLFHSDNDEDGGEEKKLRK